MAVYGNMLAAFPELLRTIKVWTKQDQSDMRSIRGNFLPTKGDRFRSQKYTSRGSAYQYFEDDHLFVHRRYKDKIAIGDFFYDSDSQHIHRIVGQMDLSFQGAYVCFSTERVTGATVEHTERLVVREATFD